MSVELCLHSVFAYYIVSKYAISDIAIEGFLRIIIVSVAKNLRDLFFNRTIELVDSFGHWLSEFITSGY